MLVLLEWFFFEMILDKFHLSSSPDIPCVTIFFESESLGLWLFRTR